MPTGTGGGSGASDVRAGGAFVEVYAKDELTQQLATITAVSKQQLAQYNAAIKAQQAQQLAATKRTTDAFKVGGTLLVAYKTANGIVDFYKRWNAEDEKKQLQEDRSARGFEQAMAARREAMADVFRQSRRIGEYGGTPAEEKGFLQKKLAGAKVQVDALAEGTRRAEDETVKLAGGWNSVIKVIPQWGQTVTIKQEAAKKMAESMNAVLADQRERVRAITAAIKDMPDQFPLFSKRANDQVRDLQTQLEMVGQTPGEAAATQARAQAKAAGLSGPGVDAKALEVRDATMDLERKQTLRSLEDQMRQLATDLEFDIQTIGKSAEEIAALRLEAFGKGGNNPNITGLIKANRNIAGLAQMRAEGLKAQGIKDDFKGFTDDLRLSIKGFGLSGDAMHALKLFTSDIYGALPQAKRDQLTGLLKLRQQQELSRVPLPSMGAFGGSGILAQQLSVSSQQGKMVVDELKAIQDILSGRLPKGISAEMAKVLKAQ